MGKKDKGWDYLNSDKNEDLAQDDGDWGYTNEDGSGSYYGSDGSWGYTNSDGSGSYYGADGSWGYKNADGSGSYYGADGSWGYKNTDGSGSYYGNDGSWGYKNSDGSGSYYGPDGDSDSYNSNDSASSIWDDEDDSDECNDDEEYDNDSDSGAEAIGTLIGLGVVGVAALHARNKAKREEEERIAAEEARRQEEARRIKKEENKEKRKRFWRTVTRKKQTVGISSEQIMSMSYTDLIAHLKAREFYKINTFFVEDLPIDRLKDENLIESCSINGIGTFHSDDEFPYNSKIEIVYHKLQRKKVPVTSRKARKQDYREVVDRFLNEGFVNVFSSPIQDLTTGWLKKDGAVESVTIGGSSEYKKNDQIRLDAHIVVSYHTFKNRKS